MSNNDEDTSAGDVHGSGNDITPHCHFFVVKKKRFCRMTIKQGDRFCGEHIDCQLPGEGALGSQQQAVDRQRVPCPYDSKHTCFKHQLSKHMARCNSKPGADLPAYIIPGLNEGHCDIDPAKLTLTDMNDEYLISLIEKMRSIYTELVQVEEQLQEHPVLALELERPGLGSTTGKHLAQNSSLLALMQGSNLLQDQTCFVEMGAGKGKLTYWLAKAVADKKDCKFALVDRASYRHKSENKLRTPELEPIRIRADIADLCLRRVDTLSESKRVVAISKHLCGAATDLALRCVASSLEPEETSHWEMRGLVMALCCHHRCVWRHYVGQQFFKDVGLTGEDFTAMCVLASWATCGSGRSRDAPTQPTQATSPDPDNKHKDRYERLNLPQERRENIGRMCKLIIDFGRHKYLETLGLKSKLLFYVKPSVTLENVCIIATSLS